MSEIVEYHSHIIHRNQIYLLSVSPLVNSDKQSGKDYHEFIISMFDTISPSQLAKDSSLIFLCGQSICFLESQQCFKLGIFTIFGFVGYSGESCIVLGQSKSKDRVGYGKTP